MKRAIIITTIALLAVLAAINWSRIAWLYYNFFPNLESIQQASLDALKEIESKIIAPPPLIKKEGTPGEQLAKEGILRLTNEQRAKFDSGELAGNTRLEQAAGIKLDDMLNKQYFDHIAPDGTGIANLAKKTGYEFILIGENLALGSFEDDSDLVNAWMQSPGHRENILNKNFKEIGIAVKKGIYEGEEVWIAVQEFGTPLSLCPKPDESQSEKISTLQNEVAQKQKKLDDERSGIENGSFASRDAYRQAVSTYNSMVADYNASVNELRTVTESYNRAAKNFNQCIQME